VSPPLQIQYTPGVVLVCFLVDLRELCPWSERESEHISDINDFILVKCFYGFYFSGLMKEKKKRKTTGWNTIQVNVSG